MTRGYTVLKGVESYSPGTSNVVKGKLRRCEYRDSVIIARNKPNYQEGVEVIDNSASYRRSRMSWMDIPALRTVIWGYLLGGYGIPVLEVLTFENQEYVSKIVTPRRFERVSCSIDMNFFDLPWDCLGTRVECLHSRPNYWKCLIRVRILDPR